ncbi:MAG: glycosyltransferase [Thermoplasmata archaeon]|nr:glycosyltransferase [Thermoplasmata archaeon]
MRIEERMVGPSGKDRAAVVIPVKDAGDDITKRCVDHLASAAELPLRVILVESSGPEFSFGRSINAGIRAAEGHEIVMCMDSDAYPEKGALSELLACMRSDQRLGYAAAVAKAPDFHPNIGWAHMSLPWFVIGCLKNRAPMFMLRRLRIGGWWTFGVRAPKEYIPGKMIGASTTTFAMRRACFDDVGPMDERFKVSFSDQDLCFRIMLSERWYLTSCPNAKVIHEEHKTRKAPKEEREFADWRLFLEKWPKKRIRELLAAARKGKFVIPSRM